MRFLFLPLTLLLVIGLAPVSKAQIRTVTITGTSTGTGTTKITIEDFDKPGRRDGSLLTIKPQAIHIIDVPVGAGWTCAQTAAAVYDSLVAQLSPTYQVTIAPTNACQIYVQRLVGGYSWSVILISNIPGQTVRIDDGAIPVQITTWGSIKARYRDTEAVRAGERH